MELHEIQSRLGDAIGELEAEFVRTIQELVRIPSVVAKSKEPQPAARGRTKLSY